MTKSVAQVVSILFHPLIMPSLGLLYLLTFGSSVFMLPYEAKRVIVIIVAINTLALPLLMIPLFYRLNVVKSLQMHSHRERLIPLAFTLIPYIFSFYFLTRLPIVNEIPGFVLGATITLALAFIVSIWWKISLHMIGIGGIAGMLFALSYRFSVDVVWHLVIVIVVAGILAWARLAANAHKPVQVYTGFITSWIIVALTIIVF
ncbi:MAG: hypothetical protein ACLFNU_06395 [Bacteroidales bacterium]